MDAPQGKEGRRRETVGRRKIERWRKEEARKEGRGKLTIEREGVGKMGRGEERLAVGMTIGKRNDGEEGRAVGGGTGGVRRSGNKWGGELTMDAPQGKEGRRKTETWRKEEARNGGRGKGKVTIERECVGELGGGVGMTGGRFNVWQKE